MSKDCGPSKAALDLDKKIGGAMDTVKDSFIGSAAGGIADGIAGLKSGLTGLTDGIVADIENAIPEIELPQATLQQQMTKMLGSLDNPGAFLSEFESIKKNFGSYIDIDSMIKDAGIDPSILKSLSEKSTSSLDQAAGALDTFKDGKTTQLAGSLGRLAAGDLSAVKDIVGEMPSITLPGFEVESVVSSICTKVPNLELDKDGNIIKKGVETKLPSEDGEKVEPAEEKNDPPPPPKEPAPADKIENGATVVLNPDSEEAQRIEKEFSDNLQEIRPLLAIVLERQAEFYNNRQEARDLVGVFRTSKENQEKIRKLKQRNRQIVNRNNKDTLYNELRLYNFEFIRDDQLFKANLILKKPEKYVISYDEIHIKTFESRYPETIQLIEELPNIRITGDKPKPGPIPGKG